MSITDLNSKELLQSSILPLENLSENAEVWKYFCKLMKNGIVQNTELVYCTLCLEMDGLKQVYPCITPINEIREHLVTCHGMEDLQEDSTTNLNTSFVTTESVSQSLDTELLEMDSETMFDQILKSSRQGSIVWNYFEQLFDQEHQKSFIYCKFCLKNNKKQTYQPSTATTNLKRHLKSHHMEELIKTAKTEDNDQPQPKTTNTKSSSVWKYFCRLTKNEEVIDESYIYCGKCLEMNINKKYRTSTSTGSLKKHLQLYHNILPVFETSVDVQAHQVMKKARRYFHKIGTDQNHYYCLVCLHQKQCQKYCISTSTSGLRNHLRNKHNIEPDNSECPPFITDMLAAIENGSIDLKELLSDEALIPLIKNREIEETDDLIEELNESTMIEYVEEVDENFEFELMEVEALPVKTQKLSVKYCRACGKLTEGCFTKLSTRFEDDETAEVTLGALYHDVIGVEPNHTDLLSVLICYECEAKLKSAFKFKQLALRTEKLMTDKLHVGLIKSSSSEKSFFEVINADEIDAELTTFMGSLAGSNSTTPFNNDKSEGPDLGNSEHLSMNLDIVAVPVESFNSKVRRTPRKTHNKSKPTSIIEESCEQRFDPNVSFEKFLQDLKCDDCGISNIDSYDSLLNHNEDTHGNAYPYMAICHKRFASPYELEAHIKYMHERVFCESCHLDFFNQEQFTLHFTINNTCSAGLQLFTCTKCNVSFASENSHSLHMAEHDRSYNCHKCSATFKEREKLAAHVKRRHRFTCEICKNSYSTLKILEIHERSHSGVRPFKCTMCPKSLVSEYGLKVHLKYVHKAFGSTDKTCNICNKTFTSKNGFIRHYRIHTGTFVKCSFSGCGKQFTTNFNLKKHVELVHDDVRAYQCCKCPKSYKSNAHLTKHIETEHMKLRFVCPLCSKTITNRWDFTHHVKRVHPDKLDTKPIEEQE